MSIPAKTRPPVNADPAAAACRLCGAHGEPAEPAPDLLRRCERCGFVWRCQALQTEAIYDDSYFASDGHYGAYFDRAAQWRFEARLRVRWLLESAQPSRLLEVGSAGGFFLEAARRSGIEAHGVEPTINAVAYAREQIGASVTEGFLEDVELPGGYEAVCAFHVLEHVAEPESFLAKARRLLAPNGWLALEVPNIDSERARREGRAWGGLVLDQHLWHFNPATLARLVGGAGLIVRRCDTAFARHYFRPAFRLRRPGLANLYRDLLATRSLSSVHATEGDLVRLLATRPA